MAWDDPSPRARAATPRPADAPPASQPGYGAAPISFGRLVFALLGAGIAGLATALATRHGLSALEGHAARATLLDVLLSIAIGLVVAVFAWRYVASRPGGGGWLLRPSRPRSMADRFVDPTLGEVVVAEVVINVVSGVIDAVID